MKDGEIISPESFICSDFFRINQCFIQRRNPAVDPVALYGKRYVDAVITYHHLQFGSVIYVDCCDYVYIGHTASITGQMAKANRDAALIWCLAVYIPALIPSLKKYFLSPSYYYDLSVVIRLALSHYRLQPHNLYGLRGMNVFLYTCFEGSNPTAIQSVRLKTAEFLIIIQKKIACRQSRRLNAKSIALSPISALLSRILFKLLIR